MIENISIQELKEKVNINIIDIRSIEKYNNGHIFGSINIPLEQLLIKFNNILDKNQKYYIYCQKGIQSKKVCQILKRNNFNAINILGGYEAWILDE